MVFFFKTPAAGCAARLRDSRDKRDRVDFDARGNTTLQHFNTPTLSIRLRHIGGDADDKVCLSFIFVVESFKVILFRDMDGPDG